MDTNAYTAHHFTDTIAVVCPKCGRQATIFGAPVDAPVADYEKNVRFSCSACEYTVSYSNTPKFTTFVNRKGKVVRGRMLLLDDACDPFFGFRLWYMIELSHDTLWAYNLTHLIAIEQHIIEGQGGAGFVPLWAMDPKYQALLLKLIRQIKRQQPPIQA